MIDARSLTGVLGPVTTPFRKDGELDRAAFEENVRAHLRAGLNGIVVAGSTGEAPLLDERERGTLAEAARALVSGDRVLLCGAGAESTRSTLKNIGVAKERGADAVLIVAPHYFGANMTPAALRSHYLAVADASALPVVLYNIPKYMHFRLGDELVAELARHQNVIGIKDSSGDKDSLAGYLRAQNASFAVLTGSGQLWRTALGMGARGGILAVSLFAPALSLGVFDAVSRGDNAAADELQERLTPLAKVIVGELGVAGVKAALDAIGGLHGGSPRSPLLPLTQADTMRVRELMQHAELAVAA